MNYKGTLGFELEVNIVDETGKVVNYIDTTIASAQILHVLEGKTPYKRLVAKAGGKIVKPELDASQLELYNPTPSESLTKLQDELAETFYLVESIVNGFGFQISRKVVPPQDFTPIHSRALDRYQFIHDSLMSVSEDHRKSTNITGTHINYVAGKNFRNHIAMTQLVRESLYAADRSALGATQDRFNHYVNVVSALEVLEFVKHGYIPHNIKNPEDVRKMQLQPDGNAIFSYELVRLKSVLQNNRRLYLSELRTVDGPTSYEDVYAKMQTAYDILTEALARS